MLCFSLLLLCCSLRNQNKWYFLFHSIAPFTSDAIGLCPYNLHDIIFQVITTQVDNPLPRKIGNMGFEYLHLLLQIAVKLVMLGASYRQGRRSARGSVEPAALAVNAFHRALQATTMFVPAMLIWPHMVAGTSVPRHSCWWPGSMMMMMLLFTSQISKIKMLYQEALFLNVINY